MKKTKSTKSKKSIRAAGGTVGRTYWGTTFKVKGVSKACLKRAEELLRAECEMAGGGVVEAAIPIPTCGGSDNPC